MAPVDESPGELPMRDLVEKIASRATNSLVLAAAIIGLAIYSRPSPPRYQAIMEGGRIVRIDTSTGTVIACEENRCMQIVRRGQHLERSLRHAPAPKQGAQPAIAPPAPPQEAAPAAR